MTPELKRYYLMQASYWCQQLIVLVFRLEKPRKDYKEYVAHHIVTLWLIGFVSGWRTLVLVYSHHCSQVELRHQPHVHRECCIYLHGCPRLFPRNGESVQLSPLGMDTKHLVHYFHRGMDVSLISYLHATSTAHALFRYFRHYLNLVMLYSVYKDFDLIPYVSLFHIHIFTCLTAVV